MYVYTRRYAEFACVCACACLCVATRVIQRKCMKQAMQLSAGHLMFGNSILT